MLCFSRDTDILSVVYHSSSNPIHAVLRGKPVSIENTVAYPPSGIIPFHGFTMYGMIRCQNICKSVTQRLIYIFFTSNCTLLYLR